MKYNKQGRVKEEEETLRSEEVVQEEIKHNMKRKTNETEFIKPCNKPMGLNTAAYNEK
jgi:hypothetical protein